MKFVLFCFFFVFSIRFGNARIQRLGNGHALYDRRQLFKRRHICASYTTRVVYIFTDAFSFHKFSGNY